MISKLQFKLKDAAGNLLCEPTLIISISMSLLPITEPITGKVYHEPTPFTHEAWLNLQRQSKQYSYPSTKAYKEAS